jgi:hypothetical protein
VSSNIANVNTVAGNTTNINTVAGISSDVTTVAGISADVTTVAANVTDITNFSDVYLGPKSSDPTTRNDSSALQAGDIYFNTVSDQMFVWDGATWLAVYAVSTNVDINGGTVDGITLGTNSAVTEAQVDNINIDGNTISTTDTDGDLVLSPDGDGVVQEEVGGTNYNLVSQYDIGTDPDEIPLNQYLGSMAYQDSEYTTLDVGTGISTGTGTICEVHASNRAGIYMVRILVDLTGLNSGGTAGDIIGVDGESACYIARLPAMTVIGGRMTCLELPAGGDTDLDLYAANEGTGAEDAAITGLTETQIINAGTQALGTVTHFSAYPAANQYLYLVGQSTSDATYTAGRFLIEIFGV